MAGYRKLCHNNAKHADIYTKMALSVLGVLEILCHSSNISQKRNRRYLELHDEIVDLDIMITSIVDELAPELIKCKAVGMNVLRNC